MYMYMCICKTWVLAAGPWNSNKLTLDLSLIFTKCSGKVRLRSKLSYVKFYGMKIWRSQWLLIFSLLINEFKLKSNWIIVILSTSAFAWYVINVILSVVISFSLLYVFFFVLDMYSGRWATKPTASTKTTKWVRTLENHNVMLLKDLIVDSSGTVWWF